MLYILTSNNNWFYRNVFFKYCCVIELKRLKENGRKYLHIICKTSKIYLISCFYWFSLLAVPKNIILLVSMVLDQHFFCQPKRPIFYNFSIKILPKLANNVKKHILTSHWSAQPPITGQNIQHLCIKYCKSLWINGDLHFSKTIFSFKLEDTFWGPSPFSLGPIK